MCPLVSHEHHVEHLLWSRAERYRPVVDHEQQLGGPTVLTPVAAQFGLYRGGQSEAGSDVGHDRRTGATDYHRIREDMLKERLGTEAAADPVDRHRVSVPHPTCSPSERQSA